MTRDGAKFSDQESPHLERMLQILEHLSKFKRPTWWSCHAENEDAYELLEARGVIERRVAFGQRQYRLTKKEGGQG